MVRIHPDPPVSAVGEGRRSERGCSSVGRAPALQAGGRRFDPVQLHQPGDRKQKKAAASEWQVNDVCYWLFSWTTSVVLFNKTEEVKCLARESRERRERRPEQRARLG